jgi:hypothetical protein
MKMKRRIFLKRCARKWFRRWYVQMLPTPRLATSGPTIAA